VFRRLGVKVSKYVISPFTSAEVKSLEVLVGSSLDRMPDELAIPLMNKLYNLWVATKGEEAGEAK